MASTFLVRLKIGSKLIDAKGVNLLYKSKLKIKYVWALIIAALFPVLVLASFSPTTQQFIRIIQLKLKLLLSNHMCYIYSFRCGYISWIQLKL